MIKTKPFDWFNFWFYGGIVVILAGLASGSINTDVCITNEIL